jgi:hypothetical protein
MGSTNSLYIGYKGLDIRKFLWYIKNRIMKKKIITNFKTGDVFKMHEKVKIVIIYDQETYKYFLGGNANDPFWLYCEIPKTKKEMLSYLNQYNCKFVKHLNISLVDN